MEVTRLNFKEALPLVSEAIENSSFIAIDCEFSGLTARKRENAMDTCKERYEKMINGIKDFTVMQFGICTFSWDAEQEQYIAKPFNFFIFPKPYNRQMPDARFLCQSSSLDFLAGQGFDFNKWISQGIPYLLPPDEDRLRRMVGAHAPKHGQATPNGEPSIPSSEAIPIPPAFEKTIEVIMEKVEKFNKDPEEKLLSLPPLSPFVRKLVYSSVKATHESGLHLESKQNEEGEKYIAITKCSEQEQKTLESKKFDKELDEIEEAVGFSKVVRLLSQSGKVILGHNMLLDLLHTIRLFVSPLPKDLDGFKALIKGVLPRLVDTKLMASTEPLKSHFPLSHLEKVYQQCSEAPFVKPNVAFPEGFNDYSGDDSKAHEAGFDAYMTGVAYIAMASFLENQRDGSMPSGEIDHEIVKPFLNKIFLFPRMEDIPYLNLDDNDIIPSRDHVFHIEHPENWQFSDIQKLFKDFGYVYISKLNGTSAFVSIANRERAGRVMQRIGKGDVPYKIQTYKQYCGCDDGDGGKDCTDSHGSCIDQSFTNTPSVDTPVKTPEVVSSKRSKDDSLEDGELSDSSEPVKKKVKGQHTFFEEPNEW
jgi:poly(A)-specific ribonuclease